VDVPAGRTFHGTSLVPLVRGGSDNWPERAIVTDSQRLTDPVKWRKSAVMTHRWRLVNGAALYDIQSDPEQRHDVAHDHPDVVEQLRHEYDRWWDTVSEQFDAEIPISLGADAATETALTCHDWRNEDCSCPWNQGHIRRGMEANGYWEIDVERAGDYAIELRRWPREVDRPLVAGIEGDDVAWRRDAIHETAWGHYTGGKALPLTEARLKVGDQEHVRPISVDDTGAMFDVHLPAGPTHLQTWLTDGADLCVGAYYVYVRRVSTSDG